MDQRNLGREGLVVSELGLGCMGMSELYGPALTEDDLASIEGAMPPGSAAGEQMRAARRSR